MKEILKKLRVLEAEMEEAENQSEYWMEEEHLDMEKSDSYEAKADLRNTLLSVKNPMRVPPIAVIAVLMMP